MTVRFLTSWNGYSAGDRATLTNEAALISAGIARADYVQDGASPLYPPNRNDAAAVVGAANLSGRRFKRSFISTRKAYQSSGAVLAGNFTILNEIAAPALFDYVRLAFLNETASSSTVRNSKVAVAGDAGNNGSSLNWTQVTFNEAGASTIPPSATGSTTTITVGAGSGTAPNAIPTLEWSDWIPISAIPRDDGGKYPILQIRTYLQTGDVAISVNGTSEALPLNTDGRGLFWRAQLDGADRVTTTTGSMVAANNSGWSAVAAVQFMHREIAFSVATVGDSITRGQGSVSASTGHVSWGHIACADLISSGQGIFNYSNFGYASQRRSVSIEIARLVLDKFDMSAIAVFPWSPNDGYTASDIEGLWARTLAFIHECVSKKTVPIICTAIPSVSLDATSDAKRKDINSRINSLPSGIAVVCDFDSVMTDGATPARISSQFSADGIHPNSAGHTEMAEKFKEALISAGSF